MNTDKYEGHTPAPWRISDEEIEVEGWAEVSGGPWRICVLTELAKRDDPDVRLMVDAPLLLAEVKQLREELVEQKKWLDAYHTKAEDMDMSDVVPSEEEVERLEKEGHWAYCYECFETNGLTDSCDDNRHTWIDEKRDE